MCSSTLYNVNINGINVIPDRHFKLCLPILEYKHQTQVHSLAMQRQEHILHGGCNYVISFLTNSIWR